MVELIRLHLRHHHQVSNRNTHLRLLLRAIMLNHLLLLLCITAFSFFRFFVDDSKKNLIFFHFFLKVMELHRRMMLSVLQRRLTITCQKTIETIGRNKTFFRQNYCIYWWFFDQRGCNRCKVATLTSAGRAVGMLRLAIDAVGDGGDVLAFDVVAVVGAFGSPGCRMSMLT